MKKILFLSLFCISGKIYSQVSLQTGSATFSLPMFNWQDNKSRLNSIVALSYSSGNGLKVNDVSSNVGQGWNLLAGGLITRIQAGEPDDQKPYFSGSSEQDGDLTKYPPGYLYNPVPLVYGVPIALTTYPIYKAKNIIYKQQNTVTADREMDHFSFQFNGRSGIFVLSKIHSDLPNHTGTGDFLGDSKMQVSYITEDNMVIDGKNIRTTIRSFTIKDENGLIYKFTNRELTRVLKTSYCDKNLNKITQPKFKNGKVYHEASYEESSIVKPYIISGWYLSEIEDALTHRKVILNYGDVRNINTSAGTSISNYTSDNTGIYSPSRNYSVISHLRSVSVAPVITSINYPDGHRVSFIYGKERVDVAGDYVLSSIDIAYQNPITLQTRYLSKYRLTTGYFILNRYGNPTSPYQKSAARLCLRSIKKIGVDLKGDDPPYTFDYYLGSSATDDFVPPPFFHLKDIWGYYNGNNSKDGDGYSLSVTKPLSALNNTDLKGLCFKGINIFSAKSGYAKNGLLKQINYPTGGSLNYDYGQSIAVLNNQNTNAYGVHVSKTSMTDGGYDNDCNNPVTTNYKYNLENSTQSSLWGMEIPVNSLTINSHYQPEYKYFYVRYPPPFFTMEMGCDYKYKFPGILSSDQAVNVTLLMQFIQVAMKIYGIISQVKTILKAIETSNPIGIIISYAVDILVTIVTCIGDHHVNNETIIYYNSDMISGNPLPVQFKRVEVIEIEGANGKTVHDFTSDEDYATWVPRDIHIKTFSSEQRYAYWAYGLPKKVTVFNAAVLPVKQTENVYDFLNAQNKIGIAHMGATYYGNPNCKYLVVKNSSLRNEYWERPSSYDYTITNTYVADPGSDNIHVRMYPVYTGRVELSNVYERTYKPGSSLEKLETVTHYTYNSTNSTTNYQVSEISTTQSNGDINYKSFRYSFEVLAGVFNTSYDNELKNLLVSTTSSIMKAGNNTRLYLGESVTEYVQLSTGEIKPYRILEQRFSEPRDVNSMSYYNGPGNQYNPAYKEIQKFTYDADGNHIGMKDEGNHMVTNIYDYNDKYVIASVVNAEPISDKPAYSSFEIDNSFGGWTLTGSEMYVSTAAVTGARSFNLTSYSSFSAALNTAKPYRLSFWSTNIITITNSTLVKSVPTINGFTYYEYNINPGAATVTVNGTAYIDELRIYPQTSRMRTVTYDPLIGKTSECDENNRITYYEYDNNSRLRFIKDEHRDIIKMYEYNVAKKAIGCPISYSNLAVSEVFTKQCTAGYVGSDVLYTISAGTYTSSISQDAVDLQVQNALNSFGQSFADSTGTCIQLFYNSAISQNFSKEGCDTGYVGSSITYTVDSAKYSSTISQADADEQAQDDIDGNGQAFANYPGNASCVTSTVAVLVGTGSEKCQNGHRMIQAIDENPNSSTYNQTQWIDTGVDATCTTVGCDSSSCIGVDRRCVDGNCDIGRIVYTDPEIINGKYYCVYHYEWLDEYWSENYYVETSNWGICPYTN